MIWVVYIMFTHSSRHQIACFKAMEGLKPPPPYRVSLSHQYSVASFATLKVLSCLHSTGFLCSCCNVVRFWYDLEACNLVTATLAELVYLLCPHLPASFVRLKIICSKSKLNEHENCQWIAGLKVFNLIWFLSRSPNCFISNTLRLSIHRDSS
jgi:hypothetical protein